MKERGSPHVYSFISIFNVPDIPNETVYLSFFEKTINTQLPDHFKYPDLFKLVKNYQMLTLELAENTTRMKIASRMVDILLRRQLLQTT